MTEIFRLYHSSPPTRTDARRRIRHTLALTPRRVPADAELPYWLRVWALERVREYDAARRGGVVVMDGAGLFREVRPEAMVPKDLEGAERYWRHVDFAVRRALEEGELEEAVLEDIECL